MGSSLSTNPGESKYDSFKRREREWGVAPEVVRYFFSTLPSVEQRFDNATVIHSFKIPFVNGKPDTQGLLAGKYDGSFKAFFASARAGVPLWWSYWHEPEDDIEEGLLTFAQWKTGFEHIKAIADTYDNDGRDLRVGVTLMGWTADTRSGRVLTNYRQAFPVDFVGWDVYTTVREDWTVEGFTKCWNGGVNVFNVSDQMITETGINTLDFDEPELSEWIYYGVEVARDLGYSHFIYYDAVDPGNATWDSRIKTAQQKAAMKYVIQTY